MDSLRSNIYNISTSLTSLSIAIASCEPASFHACLNLMKAQVSLGQAQSYLLKVLAELPFEDDDYTPF